MRRHGFAGGDVGRDRCRRVHWPDVSFFFKVEDARLQGIQAPLLATFIGLVIFMIFALDRPFRGDLGLSRSRIN